MANWNLITSRGSVEDRRDDSKFTFMLQQGAKKTEKRKKRILTPQDQIQMSLDIAGKRRKQFLGK